MLGNAFKAVAGLAIASFAVARSSEPLPTVNLGYEVHQAALFNSTGGFYNFSNIRYAEPPVGNLRFRAPVAPKGNSSTVQNGSKGAVCPQAFPAWLAVVTPFVEAYLQGKPFDYNATVAALMANSTGRLPPQDPRTSEDCLFLDVMVPKQVFEQAGKKKGGAAVLVWIHGGGYTIGSKSAGENPAGLIKASQVSGSPGVIYVSLNYRLGAFGWLSGPTLQSDGTANAGLYDQRLALQWIRDNIHLFGGDPNRVTVFGESAGGGSIMHQITAFGGLHGPAPFQQAIPQSPGFGPVPGNLQQEQLFLDFLRTANVSSIQEARKLSTEALIMANLIQVGRSRYGVFDYGPVVDGLFVPALPGKLLLQGSFDKSVKVMVGHNANEGLVFTPPFVTTTAAYTSFLRANLPNIAPQVLNYVQNVLYPPIFDGSRGYKDNVGRAALTLSESIFTCNTLYLNRAYGNNTYAYQFSVPPALHGQDVPYTYYNGKTPAVLNETVAIALQEYLTSFAETGKPSGPGFPMFPLYGPESTLLDLNVSSISEMMDPTANERCLWWQKALYF
ncbi:hypothetical protein MMC16_006307 [Acarospora aff. strigata]|nr:hypothetical protein [Acarospora aff. strigata]